MQPNIGVETAGKLDAGTASVAAAKSATPQQEQIPSKVPRAGCSRVSGGRAHLAAGHLRSHLQLLVEESLYRFDWNDFEAY